MQKCEREGRRERWREIEGERKKLKVDEKERK